MTTISDSGKRKKNFYAQFSIQVRPVEKLLLDYYSQRYGQEKGRIMRGMMRKYIEADSNFDIMAFSRWAEKAIPKEDDKEMREMMREQLRDYVTMFSTQEMRELEMSKTRP